MAYYLGRDVKVYIASEQTGIDLFIHDTLLQGQTTSTGGTIFANPRSDSMNATGQVSDLTGVDLGIGATDEDITYMGLRNVLKAEIKKETTLSLTRKKSDAVWDVIFNGDGTNTYRWGVNASVDAGSTTGVYTGLEKPTQQYGYRLHIQLKTSGEIFCIRNATITGHSVSLNPDGTTEETIEFLSQVDPKIVTAVHNTETPSTDL